MRFAQSVFVKNGPNRTNLEYNLRSPLHNDGDFELVSAAVNVITPLPSSPLLPFLILFRRSA